MVKSGKYSLRGRLNIQEIYQSFLGLGPREQIFTALGFGLVLLLVIILPLSCASSRLGKMESQITNHEKDVDKVVQKIGEYRSAQAKMKGLEDSIKPKSQVQLTTRLETLATQAGIGDKIDSLKEKPGTPGEDFEELIVDVRMSRLSLSQALEFLYGIETQKDLKLKINRMQIKPRYDDRQQFDISFEVSTLVSTSDEG